MIPYQFENDEREILFFLKNCSILTELENRFGLNPSVSSNIGTDC